MKKIVFLLISFVFITANVLAKDYVIGGGDTLNISVWGSPELSLSAKVRPDGKISIPAVGEIKVTGLTPLELKSFLEKEMKKVIKTPIVTVIVTGMQNYRIFVLGKGAPVGISTLERETTLLEFLTRLGPLKNADLKNAYLVRDKKKIKTDFYELFVKGDFSQDIILEPDDILFIPDNFNDRISVVGAVNAPTVIPYREGLTILDVILTAGGFNEFAKENDVKIIREKTNGEKTEITVKVEDLMKGEVDRNISIAPGDFVVVKESMF